MSREYAEKILKLIDKSPTAFHVIDNIKCILDAADFTGLKKGSDINSAEAPDYGPGDRVAHMKFGEGTVLSVEKGARDYEVSVDFDNAGTKKMFAGFAKLRKL